MPTTTPALHSSVATTMSPNAYAAGLGPHLPVGSWSGTRYRSAIRFYVPAWGSWTSLDKATLTIYTTDFAHVGPRNSSIYVRQQNQASIWSIGRGSQNCNSGFSGSNTTQAADIVPSQNNQVAFSSGTTANKKITIDVTAMVRNYMSMGNPAWLIFVLDQNGGSDYSEFWSEDKGGSMVPSLSIDYTVQSPPTAPTLVSPDPTGINVAVVRPTFQWTHHDPQGDPQVAADVEISGASGVITTVHPATPAGNTAVSDVDLPRGVALNWRVRTYDAGGVGAWSSSGQFAVTPFPVVTIGPRAMVFVAGLGPRLVVNWTVASTTQQQYRVQAGAFDSGWLAGSALTYLLSTVALVNGTPVSVTVSVDGQPAGGTPVVGSATQSFTPRFGQTVQRRDIGAAPLNWGTPNIVQTVPAGASITIEYGSDPAANAAPASGWLPDLSSVPKNRYVFYRATLIPSATASPVLDTVVIPTDQTVTLVDKWGTTRDVAGLSGVWAVDPGEAVYGTRSMRANVTGPGPFKCYAFKVSVKVGRTYILTGLMKSYLNSGAHFQLEDAAGNVLPGGGFVPSVPFGTPVASPTLSGTMDWYTSGAVRDTNRYKTPTFAAPANMDVYVVLVVGGVAGSTAWFDAIKLEESTVATPWSPGAIGAVVMDAGGLQVDGSPGKGGILRYRGSLNVRDTVEGGSTAPPGTNGLLFGGDTRLSSPATGILAINDMPIGTFGSGTVFPTTGLVPNVTMFWRTDMKMLFFWNGTRWLSAERLLATSGMYAGTGAAISVNTSNLFRGTPPSRNGGSDIWIETAGFAWNCATATTAANYWAISPLAYPSGTTLAQLVTQPSPTTTWQLTEVPVNALLGNDVALFNWNIAKAGAPGAIQTHEPWLSYRIVAV